MNLIELFGLLFCLSSFVRLLLIVSSQKVLFGESLNLMDVIFVFFKPKKFKVKETRKMARVLNGLFLFSILCFIILLLLNIDFNPNLNN